jgi:GrpB-like predicted nucleotidyltransferase (UPF0157 family)
MSLPPLPPASAPLTEAELRRVTVGGAPTRLNSSIEIADCDPRWPHMFTREAARIRAALGDTALAIEHVGSTSVAGLPAKPIIDIDLIVADSADEDAYVPAMEAAGYVLRVREPDWYEHRCFSGPDTRINLHVFGPDCDEHARHLIFRDWLRLHPDDRAHYEQAKRKLAGQDWAYVNQYADAKTDVIVEILQKAGLS